jgi:type IV secretory pathway VirB2 component (pilin)
VFRKRSNKNKGKQSMKTILIITITALSLFGANMPSQATKPLEELISMLTGTIFGLSITIGIIICGYMYIFGNQDKAKAWAINIFVGAIFVLIAGTIASFFV